MTTIIDNSLEGIPIPEDISKFIDSLDLKPDEDAEFKDPMEEVRDHMEEKRELSNRLESDPEFRENYIQAEKEYFDKKENEEQSDNGASDNAMAEARDIVDRMHNRSKYTNSDLESADLNDEIDLSKYGTIADDLDSEEEFDEPPKQGNGIFIHRAYKPTFILNFN